jgi:hypothetical protein
LFRVVYKGLLAHAKMLKDVIEGFLRGDLTTGYFGEGVESETEGFGEEIAA